jgi:hypothetical protein
MPTDPGSDALSGAGAGAAFGPWGAGIGAGAGLVKYFAFDKPANDRKRALAAATQKYSPWTGLSAEAPDQINPMSGLMQGAASGAAMGQNMQAAQGNQALQKAQINYLNGQSGVPSSPGAPMVQQQMQPYSADAQNPWSQYRMQQYGY